MVVKSRMAVLQGRKGERPLREAKGNVFQMAEIDPGHCPENTNSANTDIGPMLYGADG